MITVIYNMVMAEKVYYRGEGDENTFHRAEVSRLRASEDAATGAFSEFSNNDAFSNLNERREGESRPTLLNGRPIDKDGNYTKEKTLWRGEGREEGSGKKKKGFLGKSKKFGPVMLILMGLFGAGGIAFVGTSLGPFSLISNALDQFNVMRTAMNKRSTYFMRMQMDETLNTSLTNRRFGIFSSEKFKISNKMQKKLAKQHIEYQEDPDTKARYLVYTNPETGEVTGIVANEKDLGKVTSVTSGETGETTGKVMLLQDALESDDMIFTAHQNATKTVKGHIVGWFESLAESFHNRIKASRNRFFDTTDETDEEEIKKKAKASGMSEEAAESDGHPREELEETDEDGKVKRYLFDDNGDPIVEDDGNGGQRQAYVLEDPDTAEISGSDALKSGQDAASTESALMKRAEKAQAALGTAGKAQGIACGVISAVTSLNLVITGIQVAKTLNFITGLFEATQRTQIGDGGSEMMVYFNNFAEPKETEDWSGSGTNITKDVVSTKSTMASTAYNSFFGGPEVDPNDKSAQKFNRDYAIKNAFEEKTDEIFGGSQFGSYVGKFLGELGAGASTLDAYKFCLYSGMALNIAGLALDAVKIVMLFVSGGIGAAIIQFFQGLAKAAAKAIAMVAIGMFVSWIVPKVAQWLAKDLIEDIGGEDAANAIRSGANIYMGKSFEANSGGVGDEAAVLAMYRETQEVLAEDARYDRLTRSPLDPTSKYTFVGSIVQKLIPIANMMTSNSLLSTVGTLVSTTSQSALSLLPSASAASGTWYDLALNKDCPNLKGLNLVGDAYCNPYYTTEMGDNIKGMDPYEVVEKVGFENFEDAEVDNPAIKDDSELGKYIVACTLRDSQYGVKDSAVTSWIENPTGNTTVNALIDAGTGLIPIAGNLYDLAQQSAENGNMKWNVGQACIQNEEVNPDWAHYKYFAQYIEDQTLMEASGIVDESQVSAFVNRYYEQNPLDTSYEGTIARYTGMTKDEVENTIALAEYINFLGEYDPTRMYPTPVEDKVVEISIEQPMFKKENVEVALVRYVVYADLRGRVVAEA